MLPVPRLPLVPLLGFLTLVSIVPAARGQSPCYLGRYLGFGWGDGYHSHTACPPKWHFPHHQTMPAACSAPLWTVPPSVLEPLPPAPTPQPITTGSFPPRGPSLFRQPGEGSSVSISSTAVPAAPVR